MAQTLDWRTVALAEDELDDLIVDESWIASATALGKTTLIAKVFSKRLIQISALRSALKGPWKLTPLVEIRDIGGNCFSFSFETEQEKDRILGGMWSFDRCLLLVKDFDGSKKASEISFDEAWFWVQVPDLAMELMTVQLGTALGNKIGKTLAVDAQRNGAAWGKVLRIKVQVDVNKPLLRGSMVALPGKLRKWVFFKYEKLPNFCYNCGILAHTEIDCPAKKIPGQYGNWMRDSASVEILGWDFLEEGEIGDQSDNFLNNKMAPTLENQGLLENSLKATSQAPSDHVLEGTSQAPLRLFD